MVKEKMDTPGENFLHVQNGFEEAQIVFTVE